MLIVYCAASKCNIWLRECNNNLLQRILCSCVKGNDFSEAVQENKKKLNKTILKFRDT